MNDDVNSFSAANNSLGTMILKFNDKDEMLSIMSNIDSHIKVIVE